MCLVDDIFCCTFIRKGTGFFIAAVAFILCLVAIGIYYFGVVGFYDAIHIVHCAVSYFDGIAVDDFVKWVCLGEMMFNETYEMFSYVSFYVHAVRGIIPGDIAFSSIAIISVTIAIGCRFVLQ